MYMLVLIISASEETGVPWALFPPPDTPLGTNCVQKGEGLHSPEATRRI